MDCGVFETELLIDSAIDDSIRCCYLPSGKSHVFHAPLPGMVFCSHTHPSHARSFSSKWLTRPSATSSRSVNYKRLA